MFDAKLNIEIYIERRPFFSSYRSSLIYLQHWWYEGLREASAHVQGPLADSAGPRALRETGKAGTSQIKGVQT